MPARNMSKLDSFIRILIGAALIWLGFISEGVILNSLLANVVGIFGVLNIAASAVRICPVYSLARLSTVRAD